MIKRFTAGMFVLLSFAMPCFCDEVSGFAADTPTLGDDSAYTLTEVNAPSDNTITKYEIKEQTCTINYVDANGQTQTATYTTQTKTPKYYIVKYKIDTPTNNNKITNLTGDVNENFVGESGTGSGGLILNYAKDSSITGDFINNTTTAQSAIFGGMTASYTSVKDIIGDYINNSVESTSNVAQGLIFVSNVNNVGTISGDFIGNHATSLTNLSGGLVATVGTGEVSEITGNFYNNYASSSNNLFGGVIFSGKTIQKIDGVFINNEASATGTLNGGIYYGTGSTNEINGTFIGNHSNANVIYGGLIYGSNIEKISGDFVQNYAIGDNSVNGGLFTLFGKTDSIDANFYGNSAQAPSIYGGLITNYTSKISSITGTFSGNHTHVDRTLSGGLIYNPNSIGEINADFYNNYSISSGGNITGGLIYSIECDSIAGTFSGNYAQGGTIFGGIIYNIKSIANIKGLFSRNYAKGIYDNSYVQGGAIFNVNHASISNIDADFVNNYVSGSYPSGGAIASVGDATIGDLKGNFVNNYADGQYQTFGGAIYTAGTIDNITGSFVNNYAKTESDDYYALGGAIFTSSDIKISADGSSEDTANTLFSGNYTSDYRGKTDNAIFVQTNSSTAVKDNDGNVTGYDYTFNSPTVTLEAKNGGTITFDDEIDGGGCLTTYLEESDSWVNYYKDSIVRDTYTSSDGTESDTRYNLALTGDDTSNIIFNNDIINANISIDNVNVSVTDSRYLSHKTGTNSLTMNSGVLNLTNKTNSYTAAKVKEFNLNGGTINLEGVNVDFKSKKITKIKADTTTVGAGKINVVSFKNLKNERNAKVNTISFGKAYKPENMSLSENVTKATTPISNFKVSYDEAAGMYKFERKSYNPAILAAPIAAQAGAYLTQLNNYDQAFMNMDMYMLLTKAERKALRMQNSYACTDTDDNGCRPELVSGPQVGQALPDNKISSRTKEVVPTPYNQGVSSTEHSDIWVRPFASYDRVSMRKAPTVHSTLYGTFLGGESRLYTLSHGWEGMYSGYVSYTGSHQSYSGNNSIYQNGGSIGLTGIFYRGNLFTAITANVGASLAEASTRYGNEEFTMLMSGVASKTGYNFEFKNGKFIIQPSVLVSYTFINTFDYTNSAGVRVNSDPLHAIQVAPGVKFIGNLKNYWQPYAGLTFVMNFMDDTKFMANDVSLPDLSLRPYLRYYFGLQKKIGERFTGFGQIHINTIGRTGVGFAVGLKWLLGEI